MSGQLLLVTGTVESKDNVIHVIAGKLEDYTHDPDDFWLRMTVGDGVLRLQVSADGEQWPLVRLCPFPAAPRYLVGPMCCTPERAGLQVVFSDWTLTAPTGKALHDLT